MTNALRRPSFLGLLTILLSSASFAQTFSFAPPRLVIAYGTANVQPGPFGAVDVNGDGKIDIFINGHAWLGNGTGSFSTTPLVSSGFYASLLADVNGDGKADAITFDQGDYPPYGNGSGLLTVALGDGKGGFTNSTSLGFKATGQAQFTLGDFNADGQIDIAVVTAGTTTDTGPTPGVVMIFSNMGQGKFLAGPQMQLPTFEPGDQTRNLSTSLVAGDFDGDGFLDLAWGQFAQPQPAPLEIDMLHGNGDGTFTPGKTYLTDARPLSLATADLNHDGKWDLVLGLDAKRDSSGNVVPGATPRVATLLAKQSGGFYWSSAVSLPSSQLPTLSLMDLSGDGVLDAVLFEYGQIYVLQGEGGGKFSSPITVATASAGYGIPIYAPLAKGTTLASAFFSGGSCEPNCHVELYMNNNKP